MELKEKLKKLRTERNISQQALADAIFVSRSAVAKWEAGLGIPCDDTTESRFEVHSCRISGRWSSPLGDR